MHLTKRKAKIEGLSNFFLILKRKAFDSMHLINSNSLQSFRANSIICLQVPKKLAFSSILTVYSLVCQILYYFEY